LKTLITSLHPVVTVQTGEEERLEDLPRALAAEMRLPLFTWTVTKGLQRIDGQGMIHGTSNPLTLLRHMSSLTVEGIFHIKDLLRGPARRRATRAILRIHLALRKQNPASFDLAALAAATEGFSGAEIEQAVIAALFVPCTKKTSLTTNLVIDAVRQTVPLSTSRREEIEHIRNSGRNRFVSV
jgi:hypothetical protein